MQTRHIIAFIIIHIVVATLSTTAQSQNSRSDADTKLMQANIGSLIQRVELKSLTNAWPLARHVKGTVVYNTANIASLKPGYYQNDGTVWSSISPEALGNLTQETPAALASPANIQLDITGLIKFSGISPGLGKVLTSDATGMATWSAPSFNNIPYSAGASMVLSGSEFQRAALSGDISAAENSNTTTINPNAVTSSKIADHAVGISKLPAGASADAYLRGDGTWAIPTPATPYTTGNSIILSGSEFQRAALTGDITALENSNVTTLADNAVATSKIAANAVNSEKIADASITNSDLAVGAGGIYNGSGVLASNTTVSQGTKSLTFDGTGSLIKTSGNVGLGTTTPTARLDVNGQVRISGGSPAEGKVLASDINGLASWVYPAEVLTVEGTAPIVVTSGVRTIVSLVDGGVSGAKLADNAVTSSKILNNSVTISKLPTGATSTTFLRGDGTWTNPYLASSTISIVGAEIHRAALTGDVTAPANSNTTTIANEAVTTPKIANNAITIAKLPTGATSTTFLRGDGTWTNPYLASSTISIVGAELHRAALTGDVTAPANSNTTTIANEAVTTPKIANNAITIAKLPTGATSTTFLRGDGTWTNPYLASSTISIVGAELHRAALTGDVTAPANSNTTTIANEAVTTPKIANNAITIAKLPTGATSTTFLRGDGTWTNPYLASSTISIVGAELHRAALTGDVTAPANSNTTTIANEAVTTPKIANNAITIAKLPAGASVATFLRGDGTWATAGADGDAWGVSGEDQNSTISRSGKVILNGGTQVIANDINNGLIVQGGASNAGYGSIYVSGTNSAQKMYISAKHNASTPTNTLNLATNADIILNNDGGRVGIGTSPSNTLDINGTARIRSLATGSITDKLVTTDNNGVLYQRNVSSISPWLNSIDNSNASVSTESIYFNGNVGIGTNLQSVKLDVNGYIKVGSADAIGDASPEPGIIRFNTATGKFEGYIGGPNAGWVAFN